MSLHKSHASLDKVISDYDHGYDHGYRDGESAAVCDPRFSGAADVMPAEWRRGYLDGYDQARLVKYGITVR